MIRLRLLIFVWLWYIGVKIWILWVLILFLSVDWIILEIIFGMILVDVLKYEWLVFLVVKFFGKKFCFIWLVKVIIVDFFDCLKIFLSLMCGSVFIFKRFVRICFGFIDGNWLLFLIIIICVCEFKVLNNWLVS